MIEFVTELPKTLTGKVLRRRLRQHASLAGGERER
jgi:acyl-coenzyme A synthetase/AMP-(fatty) acid ligase